MRIPAASTRAMSPSSRNSTSRVQGARATGSGSNQAVSTARRAAATLGHQRRTTAAIVSAMPAIVETASGPPGRTRFTVGSNPIAAKTSPETGRPVATSSRRPMSIAQPAHMAAKSMSVPSLSKTTRSIPSRRGGGRPAAFRAPIRVPA